MRSTQLATLSCLLSPPLWQVMLKDMADSKRINTNVQAIVSHAPTARGRKKLVDTANVSATILSGLFWPGLVPQSEEGDVKLHQKVPGWLLDALSV